MNPEDKLIIDLDNTITVDSSSEEYSSKKKNIKVVEAIKKAAAKSIEVIIFSARNMRSFNGDLEKINEITKPIALSWLDKNQVIYDEVIFGKPWAGKGGWYIDDRNLSLEEFIFKFSGPFSGFKFDILIPFFNEEENIENVFEQTTKLDRLLDIKTFIFINNGSKDKSELHLKQLKKIDKRIKVINIKNNEGYGNGIKIGLERVTADYVLINHSDGQFDAYQFILSNSESLSEGVEAVMPQRYNRSLAQIFCTGILKIILSMFNFKIIHDFNGQPKIFKFSSLKNIENLPKDFCIDYSLYKIFEDESLFLPVIQKDRKYGTSSWNTKLIQWIRIFFRYLWFSLFFNSKDFK